MFWTSFCSTMSVADFNYYMYLTSVILLQRMVKSLSADKVVWDAVMKNEVVRELRDAISAGWCFKCFILEQFNISHLLRTLDYMLMTELRWRLVLMIIELSFTFHLFIVDYGSSIMTLLKFYIVIIM